MSPFTPQAPRWYTASAGRTADVSIPEQSALQSHLALCRTRHSHLAILGSGASTMQGWMATRFATVALALTLLIVGGLWLS
ncbi:MAG TPA: hypothetical protein VFY35_13355 [Burkholderiaceae bacterium]|nr:hypothetical protein [Burkholderiaceae bacterium]